jgi:hypothetical protein
MKTSTALTLVAVGAILAFAVHGRLSFVNFNAAGWVIMIVGLAGLFAPPGTQRWLRRRLIVRDASLGPAAPGTEVETVEEVTEAGDDGGFRPADPAVPYVEDPAPPYVADRPDAGGTIEGKTVPE